MAEGRSISSASHRPTWVVVGCGMVALAAAMGIGRFAFTPLLPLMVRDGTLDASTGAVWAAANYVGYLVGALTAGRFARNASRGLSLALFGVALTTLAAAATGPATGLALRAAAGVFSAWTLVCASGVVLGELARRGHAHLGAWIYAGVGMGIALAGTLGWLGGRQAAASLWLEMGLAALGAALVVRLSLRGIEPAASTERVPPSMPAAIPSGPPFCYGVSGFGYIVPATFLPAMASERVSDPLVFGLAWPLFGLAAALSVAGAACWLSGWPRLRVWSAAQGIMALGTLLPAVTQNLAALSASAVLVGGTFMVATMAGLQWARETRPADATPLMARMTVAFAAGQIAGPLLVRSLDALLPDGADALAAANVAAAALLALTSALLWRGGSTPISRRAS